MCTWNTDVPLPWPSLSQTLLSASDTVTINLCEAKITNVQTLKLSRWQDKTVQYTTFSLPSSTQIAVINLFRLNSNRLPLWDFVHMSVIEIFNLGRWAVTEICLYAEWRTSAQRLLIQVKKVTLYFGSAI